MSSRDREASPSYLSSAKNANEDQQEEDGNAQSSALELHITRMVERVRRIKGIHLRVWSTRPHPCWGKYIHLALVVRDAGKKNKRCVKRVARVDKWSGLLLGLETSTPRGYASDERVERFFTPFGLIGVPQLIAIDPNYDICCRRRLKRTFFEASERFHQMSGCNDVPPSSSDTGNEPNEKSPMDQEALKAFRAIMRSLWDEQRVRKHCQELFE